MMTIRFQTADNKPLLKKYPGIYKKHSLSIFTKILIQTQIDLLKKNKND